MSATRGGAIERFIMSLVKRNEIEQRMNLIVVSIDDARAREDAKQYPHTDLRFIAPAAKLPDTMHHYAQAIWKRVNRHSHVVASLYYHDALRAIRSDAFDAVVFEGGEGRGFTAYDRIFHGKLWYHVHANPTEPTESAYFDNVMVLSNFVLKNWRYWCSDKHQHLHAVHNGVDTALFERSLELDTAQSRRDLGYAPDDFVVMYCGRVSPEKGVKQLVDAVDAIDDSHVKLVIIGYTHDSVSEQYLAGLKQQAESMDGRVTFAGYVPNDQLDVYYAATDVQGVPSQWEEGAGNVCIEGMAAGKPIIASNCAASPNTYHPIARYSSTAEMPCRQTSRLPSPRYAMTQNVVGRWVRPAGAVPHYTPNRPITNDTCNSSNRRASWHMRVAQSPHEPISSGSSTMSGLYVPASRGDRWYMYLTNDTRIRIWHFQKRLCISEYWFNNRHRSPLHYLMFLWKYRLKNNAAVKLGIGISENSCDIGLRIYHEGGTVINGNAKKGKNLHLHGRNCIGNRGVTGIDDESNWGATPIIGDNVEFGMGASAIDGIVIDDDVKIGAGAVVVRNRGYIGGVPAKTIE